MNALEQTQKTEEQLIKTINESKLPLTTVYYMLANIQRQISDALDKQIEAHVNSEQSE